jgi:hypothetical protein
MSILSDYGLTEEEAAAELKKKPSTLERWRRERKGPPWTYNGKTVIYPREGLREYLRSGEVRPPRRYSARNR